MFWHQAITVLRHTEYKNCPVYILNFGAVFQRLFIYKNEIYQYHIFLKPNIFRYLLYFIGLRKTPYTNDELDEGETIILNEACNSIDAIKNKKK